MTTLPKRRSAVVASLAVLTALVVPGCAAVTQDRADAATAPSSAATTAAPAQKLIWSDEFKGAAGTLPDATKWSYAQGGDGWGNDELECYTDAPGNVSLDGTVAESDAAA